MLPEKEIKPKTSVFFTFPSRIFANYTWESLRDSCRSVKKDNVLLKGKLNCFLKVIFCEENKRGEFSCLIKGPVNSAFV